MEDEGLTTVRQRWTEGRQSRTRRRADEGFEERAAQRVEGGRSEGEAVEAVPAGGCVRWPAPRAR